MNECRFCITSGISWSRSFIVESCSNQGNSRNKHRPYTFKEFAELKMASNAGGPKEAFEAVEKLVEAGYDESQATLKVKLLTDYMKVTKLRISVRRNDLKIILNILNRTLQTVVTDQEVGGDCSDTIELCTECARCLRNATVQCKLNQDNLLDLNVVETLAACVSLWNSSNIHPGSLPSVLVLLRCTIQLASNLVSGNEKGQHLLWKRFYPISFKSVFQSADSKACHYCCMFMMSCFQSQKILDKFLDSSECWSLLESVLNLCLEDTDMDFGLQLINNLLLQPSFLSDALKYLYTPSKIILTDIVSAHFDYGGEATTLPSTTIILLAETFEKLSHNILSLATRDDTEITDEQIPVFVTRLLACLCVATAEDLGTQSSLEGSSLVKTSVELLEMVHKIGKSGGNVFSVDQTLQLPSETTLHPVFGFKRDLVRLIGNLCYESKTNQDLVREHGGISTILEQCNIDDKNPFINQWAIFAIRNLCENNLENQNVIAGLKQEGVANNKTLATFGYEAVTREDGGMYLKNMKKK